MLRAAMPEAAINEYGHARPAKYDVRCPSQVAHWSSRDPEPEAKRVSGPP